MKETLNRLKLVIDTELAKKLCLTVKVAGSICPEVICALVDISDISTLDSNEGSLTVLQRFHSNDYNQSLQKYLQKEEIEKVRKVFMGLFVNNKAVYATAVVGKNDDTYQTLEDHLHGYLNVTSHFRFTEHIVSEHYPNFALGEILMDDRYDILTGDLLDILQKSVSVELMHSLRKAIVADLYEKANKAMHADIFDTLVMQSAFDTDLHIHVMEKENALLAAHPALNDLYKVGRNLKGKINGQYSYVSDTLSNRHREGWNQIYTILQGLYNTE